MGNEQNQNTDTTQETSQESPAYLTREQADAEFAVREQKMMAKFEKLLENRMPKPPKVDEEKLSRTAEMEKQIKELSTNIQQRDAREKDQSLRSTVVDAARTAGFDRDFEDHLVAYLVDAKKLVRYAEDGSIQMTVGGVVYYSVKAGMQAFSATRDAKLYRPATGAQGTGDRNKQANYGTPNPASEEDGQGPVIKRDENGRMTKESRLSLEKYFR
jgi:hypothetical protein